MKKFLSLLLTATLMVSCSTMNTKQLLKTLENSIDGNIDDVGQTLIDHGFVESSRRCADKVIFEHGDTIVYIVVSMADQRKVGGAYVCINCATAEKALKQYHEFRDLCRNDDKFYGCKVIKYYAENPNDVFYASTDPQTIDTLTAKVIENNGITTINERWEEGNDTDNRTVVAMFKNQYDIYCVTAVFRTSLANPSGFE